MGNPLCTFTLRKTHSGMLGSQESTARLCTEPDPPPRAAVRPTGHLKRLPCQTCQRRRLGCTVVLKGCPEREHTVTSQERKSFPWAALPQTGLSGWTRHMTPVDACCLPWDSLRLGVLKRVGSQAWGQGTGTRRGWLGLGSGEATAPIPLTLVHAWEGCVRWWHRGGRPGRGVGWGAVSLGQWL